MNNKVKVLGVQFHENTILEFNSKGIKMYVTLNIPKEMIHVFRKDNLYKAEKRYFVKAEKQITDVSKESLIQSNKQLIKFLMAFIRKAKSVYYHNESKKLLKS